MKYILNIENKDKPSLLTVTLVKRMNWYEDKAVQQVLEVAYQVLPQTDKFPMRKQLEDIVTWVDSWAKFFKEEGIWDKKQKEKEVDQLEINYEKE